MLTKEDKANLINIAMQAEAECYNRYFMTAAADILKKYAKKHGIDYLMNFLRMAAPVTSRLYLELCYLSRDAIRQSISFTI